MSERASCTQALAVQSAKRSGDGRGVNLRGEAALGLERASLGLANHGAARRPSDDVVILRRRLCLHVHIHVSHGFLVRRRWICDAGLPRCEVVTHIGRVRLVALPPLIHGDDGEGGVSLADGGAALGPFARVALPRGEGDYGDDEQQHEQGQD